MVFLQRIWDDIKRGENFDLYVTISAAIILAVLNLLGIVPQSLTPLTLTVLALLALATLGDRHRLEEILGKLTQREENFFQTDLSNKQQKELNERIEKSTDMLLLGTSLSNTLDLHYPIFEQKLQRGDAIRIVIENPYSPACDMAVRRRYRPTDVDAWRTQVLSTLNVLKDLQTETSGNLQIRVIDFHLAHGGILIDANTANGMFFLWYYSFKTRKGNRPKYVLRPDHGYWYWHFVEEANAIWDNSQPWESIVSD